MRRLLVPALLALAGCAATGNGLTRFEREQLAQRERGIAMATQRIHDPATLARVADLLARLAPDARLRVYVVEHPAPQAELIGGEVLLVRSGLLEAARSNDELAFVLAHEVAHGALGHLGARREPGWDALAAEIAADRWAVARLAQVGFEAGAGLALLDRLLPAMPAGARAVVERRRAALAESAARVPPYDTPSRP